MKFKNNFYNKIYSVLINYLNTNEQSIEYLMNDFVQLKIIFIKQIGNKIP